MLREKHLAPTVTKRPSHFTLQFRSPKLGLRDREVCLDRVAYCRVQYALRSLTMNRVGILPFLTPAPSNERTRRRSYGKQTQSQLVARARFLTCPKNVPKWNVTPGVCMGAPTPPKLNIPKRCCGKRFSRSGCPKRAVTGNGRARGRACGARAPRGATSKPLRNPHVAPPTTDYAT